MPVQKTNTVLQCCSGWLLSFIPCFFFACQVIAQCPLNIDFENGNFDGWECESGTVTTYAGNRVLTLTSSPPTFNRHSLHSAQPAGAVDYYGDFPVLCPNGSGYSIRLGNAQTRKEAERVYYSFTIPAGQDKFSLYYNYAVVLQDPGHLFEQQPRLSIEVWNLTDNVKDTCASFDFVVNGGMPGFQVSSKGDPGAPVRFKPWSAASINLEGKAGKTFRISFTTSDCTLGDHFGYAYIDINSDCSSTLLGTIFCPYDPFVKLTAPPGFQSYRWFDNTNSTLGTEQTITFTPPPRGGDTVHVEFVPYNGYGCKDTLTAYLWDTLAVVANAGADRTFCVDSVIQLGEPARYGLLYSWSPAMGLSDPAVSNPYLSAPFSDIQYTLTVTSPGAGCSSTDMVFLDKQCDHIEIYVPAAFTPNGDGNNDLLRPHMIGFQKLNYFRVYNRYGQLLFFSNMEQPGWDGTFKGKPVSTQTVIWSIEAVNAFGVTEKRQGTAVLIR